MITLVETKKELEKGMWEKREINSFSPPVSCHSCGKDLLLDSHWNGKFDGMESRYIAVIPKNNQCPECKKQFRFDFNFISK